jgi:hypothetical protein
LFDEVGYFDEELEVCEDYDFWLRVSCRYPIILIPEYSTLKDGGRQDQLSFKYRPGMDRFRIRAIEKLLDSGVLNDDQFGLAVREIKRKCEIFSQGALKREKNEVAQFYQRLSEKWQQIILSVIVQVSAFSFKLRIELLLFSVFNSSGFPDYIYFNHSRVFQFIFHLLGNFST